MKEFFIKEIGEININKSKKAKRLSIRIANDGKVLVVIPVWIPYKLALSFAQKEKSWILKHKEKSLKNLERQKINDKGLDYNTLKARAKVYLPSRLAYLSKKHGLEYRKLSLRNQKTLWGSCSAKNNISLNIKLMDLPDHLIDYVILHELTHTVQKNHGPAFWRTLEQYSPGARTLAKELRSYRITGVNTNQETN